MKGFVVQELHGSDVVGFTVLDKYLNYDISEPLKAQLREAVAELDHAAVRVAIYNHQLCTLHPSIRPFAVQSISDWKREYIEACGQCDVRAQCGGFFGTSGGRHSAFIVPIALQ